MLSAGLAASVLRGRVRWVALAAVPVVIAVECLSLLVPFWPRTPRADFYPVTGVHRYLADHLGPDRFGAKGLTLLSGTNVAYGLRNVTGPRSPPRSARPAARVDPSVPDARFSLFSGTPAAPPPLAALDLLAVRYFAFAPLDPCRSPRRSAGPHRLCRLRPGRRCRAGGAGGCAAPPAVLRRPGRATRTRVDLES